MPEDNALAATGLSSLPELASAVKLPQQARRHATAIPHNKLFMVESL